MKTIIITGCQGMDGSTLADIYLERGDKVIGLDMWKPTGIYDNLQSAIKNPNFTLETGDLTEKEFIYRMITKYKPDIFYNMGAISLVPESFKIPRRVFEVNTLGVLNCLEVIREYSPHTKFYQASSSEQFGWNTNVPQDLDSKMLPNSPYAVSKLASYHMVRLYREAFGLFAVNGVLWNHEGPRRGPHFVTRKITKAVANIKMEKQKFLSLGNMDAKRDWGLSKDYCEAMMLMMEHDTPDDYPIATGETHSVREFVEEAFRLVDIDITWKGEDKDEVGIDQYENVVVKIDERYYRPNEVSMLYGNPSKSTKILGWKPKTTFKELVKIMVEHDLKEVQK